MKINWSKMLVFMTWPRVVCCFVSKNAKPRHINALFSSSFNCCTMNCNDFHYDCFPILLNFVCVWTAYAIWIKIGNVNHNKNDKEYGKFLLISCFSCKKSGSVERGINFIFGHIFKSIYSKIRTGFYFAFSSFDFTSFHYTFF